MDKADPPPSCAIFKPVAHKLTPCRTAEDLQAEGTAVVARKLKATAARRHGGDSIEDPRQLTPEGTTRPRVAQPRCRVQRAMRSSPPAPGSARQTGAAKRS